MTDGVRIEAASLTVARSVAGEIDSALPVVVIVDGEIVYTGDIAGLLRTRRP